MFQHPYTVAFADTDAMGVVHHGNYVRILEIGRVAWMKSLRLSGLHIPHGPLVFAVTNLQLEFRRSAQFDDSIRIFLQGRQQGAGFELQYALWVERLQDWGATGHTQLVPLIAATLKPTRFSMADRAILKAQPWSESWPPDRSVAASS